MDKLKVPILETERLILKPIQMDDAQALFEICSLDSVTQYLSYESHKSIEETQDVLENIFLKRVENGIFEAYVVWDKEKNKLIGTCDFVDYDGSNAVIGYMYHPDYWGKGIATESLNAVIDVAFNTLDIHRLEIAHILDNIGSQRVIEKCGFKKIGVKRQAILKNGSYEDIVEYDMLREDKYE